MCIRDRSVEEAIQKRIEYQKSCFEGYGVDQMELINNAMTVSYTHLAVSLAAKVLNEHLNLFIDLSENAKSAEVMVDVYKRQRLSHKASGSD